MIVNDEDLKINVSQARYLAMYDTYLCTNCTALATDSAKTSVPRKIFNYGVENAAPIGTITFRGTDHGIAIIISISLKNENDVIGHNQRYCLWS